MATQRSAYSYNNARKNRITDFYNRLVFSYLVGVLCRRIKPGFALSRYRERHHLFQQSVTESWSEMAYTGKNIYSYHHAASISSSIYSLVWPLENLI
jgi:hypothetical protein